MTPTPQPHLARDRYDRLAPAFDRRLPLLAARQERIRREAVGRLRLLRGQVVLDVGCGTGASFSLLEDAVGPEGRIIGCEQSAGMLARARERIARHRWDNVTLVEAPAHTVTLPGLADGALFFFTHDILRSSDALSNVLAYVRPDAPVVAAGGKRGRPWNPLNLLAWVLARPYVTTFEGVACPWDRLARHLEGLDVRLSMGGFVYVVSGRCVPSVYHPTA